MLIFVLFLVVPLVLFAWWYWDTHAKHVPFSEFGMEAVHRVLKFEDNHVRTMILNRGWITSAEWLTMNKRHVKAIEAELRRRGVQDKMKKKP